MPVALSPVVLVQILVCLLGLTVLFVHDLRLPVPKRRRRRRPAIVLPYARSALVHSGASSAALGRGALA